MKIQIIIFNFNKKKINGLVSNLLKEGINE